jgi:hypothetical protein
MIASPVKCTVMWMPISIDPGSASFPIVYCTNNGKLGTIKRVDNWKWLCEKYNIKYWTYQNDIIPVEFR